MSGIFGIFHRDGRPVDAAKLVGMSDSMAYRGPDDQGAWINGLVGIGHRMLQTTPESCNEKQPFIDDNAGLVITADARIDNRVELGVALGLARRINEGIPDSHLILAAYEKWGDDCATHLLGDFAFVIWDAKRESMICARDHIGLKPFCYFVSDELFVFASSVSAIRSLSMVPKSVNEARIGDHLVEVLEGIDHTSTFFSSIKKLPPSHRLVVTKNRYDKRRYWEPFIDQNLVRLSDEDCVEAFQEVFTESVQCRLRAINTPGVMLSGGIDSASIVAIARLTMAQREGRDIQVFSGIDPEAPSLDTACIQQIVNQGAIKAHLTRSREIGKYRRELQWILPNADEPFDHFMLIPQLMYIVAKSNNVSVLLDGGDGDLATSLTGSYISRLVNEGKWREGFREAVGLNRMDGKSAVSGWGMYALALRSALIPDLFRSVINRFRLQQSYHSLIRESIINPEFARGIGLKERLASSRDYSRYNHAETFSEEHARRIVDPWVSVGCERYNRVAGYYGVESRSPLLDRRLLELSIGLPWSIKIRSGVRKYILRKSVSELLPSNVVWRTRKDHLVPQFQSSLFQIENQAIQSVLESAELIDDYIDMASLNKAYQRYSANGNFWDGMTIWKVIGLNSWLKAL